MATGIWHSLIILINIYWVNNMNQVLGWKLKKTWSCLRQAWIQSNGRDHTGCRSPQYRQVIAWLWYTEGTEVGITSQEVFKLSLECWVGMWQTDKGTWGWRGAEGYSSGILKHRKLWGRMTCSESRLNRLGETVVKGDWPNHKVSHADWGSSWGQFSVSCRERLGCQGSWRSACDTAMNVLWPLQSLSYLMSTAFFLGSGHDIVCNIALSLPSFTNASVGQKHKTVIISPCFVHLVNLGIFNARCLCAGILHAGWLRCTARQQWKNWSFCLNPAVILKFPLGI